MEKMALNQIKSIDLTLFPFELRGLAVKLVAARINNNFHKIYLVTYPHIFIDLVWKKIGQAAPTTKKVAS